MLRNIQDKRKRRSLVRAHAHSTNRGLKLILWIAWTLVVIGAGYLSWHAAVLAQRPVDLIGLTIHCAVVGVIGLVVLTLIEQWLEPWRFLG